MNIESVFYKVFSNLRSNIVMYWASIYFLVYTFFRPLHKQLEYVYGISRINYSAVTALLVLLIIGYSLLNLLSKQKNVLAGVAPISLITLLAVLAPQIVHYFYSIDYSSFDTFLKIISVTFFGYIGFFLLGLNLHSAINTPWFVITVFCTWLGFSGFELVEAIKNDQGFFIDLKLKSKSLNANDIYLMLSEGYMILSFVAMTLSRTLLFKLSVYLVSVASLLAMHSRSSFYLYTMLGLIHLAVMYKKFFALSGIVVAALFLTFQYHLDFNQLEKLGLHARMYKPIEEEKDGSWEVRKEYFAEGLRSINRHWLAGDFMGEIRDNRGETGYYIHNGFSYWRQFGIVGFGLVVFVLVYYTARNYWFFFWKRRRTRTEEFIAIYSTYALASIIFSKSYLVPYLWLAISALPVSVRNYRIQRYGYA